MAQRTYEFKNNQPHLIFPIGLFAAAPLGFPRRLANELGATCFSFQKAFRYALHEMSYRGETPDMSAWDKINDTLLGWTEESLRKGSNVVLDNYYHTRKSRADLCNLARECGAVSIGLVMTTPLKQSEDRADEWHYQDIFEEVPQGMWPQRPNTVVSKMLEELEWLVNEPIDYSFDFTSSRKPHSTSYRTQNCMHSAGLLVVRDPVAAD